MARAGRMEQTKLDVEWWTLDEIRPYENNPRHNDHAVEKMAGLIAEFGFWRPLLVRGDGGLIDGHLTLKGALQAGKTHGPVLVCDDLTEGQISALRLAMNKSAEWAQWDEEKLAQELQAIMDAGFDVDMLGFDDESVRQLLDAALDFSLDSPDPEEHQSLRELFIVPPFSILDTRQGYWQERKAAWKSLLPNSQEGRSEKLTFSTSLNRFCSTGAVVPARASGHIV